MASSRCDGVECAHECADTRNFFLTDGVCLICKDPREYRRAVGTWQVSCIPVSYTHLVFPGRFLSGLLLCSSLFSRFLTGGGSGKGKLVIEHILLYYPGKPLVTSEGKSVRIDVYKRQVLLSSTNA